MSLIKTNSRIAFQLRQLRRRIERLERAAIQNDENRRPRAENPNLGENDEVNDPDPETF
jgi:hypothetical protein